MGLPLRIRLSHVAFLACAAALSTAAIAQDDEDDVAFREELTRLLDRWNDGAPEDRLGKAIELCTKRVKAKSDDSTAHLELARLALAKNDGETAATEARRAETVAQGSLDRMNHAQALHYLAYRRAQEDKLAKEADADKQKKLADDYKKNAKELYDKLVEALKTADAAGKVLREELDRIESARYLNELGRPPRELESKKDQDGTIWRFDAYLGKVVIVVFWGAWDPAAKAKLEEIRKVQEQYKDRGVEALGISLDRDRAQLEQVMKDAKISWRHYFDGKGEQNDLAQAWKVQGYACYLLDHTGRIRYVNVHGEGLDAAVKQLVERAEKASKKKKGD